LTRIYTAEATFLSPLQLRRRVHNVSGTVFTGHCLSLPEAIITNPSRRRLLMYLELYGNATVLSRQSALFSAKIDIYHHEGDGHVKRNIELCTLFDGSSCGKRRNGY